MCQQRSCKIKLCVQSVNSITLDTSLFIVNIRIRAVYRYSRYIFYTNYHRLLLISTRHVLNRIKTKYRNPNTYKTYWVNYCLHHQIVDRTWDQELNFIGNTNFPTFKVPTYDLHMYKLFTWYIYSMLSVHKR